MTLRKAILKAGVKRGKTRRRSFFGSLSFCLLFLAPVLSPSSSALAATTVYLSDTISSINPGADDERKLSRIRGASLVTYTKNTVAGAVTPPTAVTQFTKAAAGTVVTWFSDPLDAVTINGNVTFNIWARESANQANAGLTAELLRADGDGNLVATIATVRVPPAELTTTLAVQNWARVPAPTALANGDRLALRMHIDDGGGTMTTGRTVTATLDGPNVGVSGDSWFSTVETLAPASPVLGSITGITQTKLTAAWTLVDGATGYTLASSVNAGASPSPVYSSVNTPDASALLSSPALAPNTTYYIYARSNGPGASSSWAPYAPLVTPAYPPVFTGLTAISSYSAQINWSANGNHAATLYRVQVSTAADPLAPFGAVVTTSDTYNTSLSTAGLKANTAYSFRVVAIDRAGVFTDYIPLVSTYTLAALPVAAPFSGVSEAGITAAWTSGGNPGGTLYRLLVSTAADPLAPGGAAVSQQETYNLSIATAGLSANTTYYFRAAGVNGDGVAGTYFSAVSTATLAVAPVFSDFSLETFSSLRFAWTSGGNPGGTLYRVLSSTAPDPLAPGGAVVASSNTYDLFLSSSGLTADTLYYFVVAAVNRNSVLTSYTAAQSRATLLQFTPAPAAFSGVAEGGMQFNFTANGNRYPETLFRVLSSTAPDPESPGGAAVVSSDTYNISLITAGLAANTTYYFKAAGVNKNGVLTAYAAAAATSTLAAVPSGFDFTETSSHTIRLTWPEAGGQGTLYRVLVSTAPDPLAPGGAPFTSSDTFNVYLSSSGLTNSKQYNFMVRASNNNGIATAWSSIVSTTTLAPGTLAAPLAGSRVPHISSMTASWQLSAGATGYTLAASLSPADPPVAIAASSTTLGELSAQVPGLSPDTVYYLFVRANGPGLSSSWSNYPSAATLLQFNPAFGAFDGTSAGSVSLSWSGGGNPGGTLYRVLSSTAADPLSPAGAAVVSSDTYNLSLTSSSLAANRAYSFRIAGVNKDGALTAWTVTKGTSTLANQPAPAGFSGTGASAMTFSWTAAGNADGTLYRVRSSTAPDPLAPGGAAVVSSDTYNLSLSSAGLQPNTTCYFRAAAVNNDGVPTSYSAAQANATLPNAPASPGFGALTDSSIDFMWTANGNPGGTLYRVLTSTAPDPLSPGGAAVTSSDTYNLSLSSSGLPIDRLYYFAAAALGRDGQATAYTSPQAVRTLTIAPVFSNFANAAADSLDFSWTANGNPGGTLYRVAVSTAPDPLAPGGAQATLTDSYSLTVTSSGLTADTAYYFRVASVNGDGAVTAYTAAQSTATLLAYPPLFTEFTDIQTDSMKVVWTANGNADGAKYRVAVSTAPDPLNPGAAKVTYADTYDLFFTSSGLVTNTLYYFRLAGVNQSGVATAYTAAQSEKTLQIVTKLYLLDDVSTASPDANEERKLSWLRGGAVVTYTKNTAAGAVTPPTAATQLTRVAAGVTQTWYTGPLDPVVIAGSVTFNVWARESAAAANAGITAELLRADNAGVVQSVIASVHVPSLELSGATLQSWSWTKLPTQTSILLGERLALRLHIDDAGGTMTTGRTVTVTLAGPTLGVSGDSWVQLLEDVRPARPASLSVTGVTAAQASASWPLVGETTGYTLVSSLAPGAAPPSVFSSSETTGGLSAALAQPALSPDTTYYLYVKSNAPGVSSGWQVYNGTSTLLAYDPAASGFGGADASSLLFDWSANGNADPGTRYRVVSSTAPDPLAPGGAPVASSYTYNTYLSSAGLSADTTYYFRVAGLNHNDVPTAYTLASATATLLAFPPAFSNFSGISQTAMQFNWSANGNQFPGTLYRVLSSTAPDPQAPGGAVVASSYTYNLSLSSSGLAANTTYYFQVAGVNKNGVYTSYTAAAGTATLVYAASFGSFTGAAAGSLSLDWTGPGNPPDTLYRVVSSTAADPLAPAGAPTASSDTYNLGLSSAGLAADTTYYFRVAAVNRNGVAGAYTAAQGTATLAAYPPLFSSFSGVTAAAEQFNWSANGNAFPGTRYRVLASTAPDPQAPGGAVVTSSYTYNLDLSSAGLAADTTYYFTVAAVNKNNIPTAYTAAAGTATLLAFNPTPGAFSGVGAGAATFAWNANGNAFPGTLYRVLSSTAPDPASPAGAVVASSLTYSLSLGAAGLDANTTYYFRVAGVNKNNIPTAYTAAAGTSTLANTPSGFDFTSISSVSIRLDWEPSGNRPGTLYSVLSSTAPDPLAPAGAAVVSSQTYNLYLATAGLQTYREYYFRAAAVNNNGVFTAYSTAVTTKTLAAGALAAPLAGTLAPYVSSITANWSLVPSATGYLLAASLSPANPPAAIVASSETTGGLSASAEGLAPDAVHYLFVRSNGPGVASSWSDFSPKATLLAFPPVFTAFGAVDAVSASLNWSANGNAYPGTLFRVVSSTAPDPLAPGGAAVRSSDTYNASLSSSSLAADTTYYFRIAGVNKDGVLTDYTAPQATATWANAPAAAAFTGVGAGAIQFNWSAAGNRNPGTLYRALVSTAPDPGAPGAAVVSSSDTYNLYLSSSGLAADTTYYFRAAALGVSGKTTAYSAPAGTSTLAAFPPVFSGFTDMAADSVRFNWTANGNRDPGTRYKVLSSTAPDPSAPGGAVVASSYTYNLYLSSSGLPANATYYFTAAAVNNNGVLTAYTAAAGTATLANIPLTAVSTFSALTSVGFTAAWGFNGNPAGTLYSAQLSTASDFNAGAAGTTVSTAPQAGGAYSFGGLLPNRDYYFRVAAVNRNGVFTSYAELGSTRTLGLAAPADLLVTETSTYSITASWALVTGATGYTLAASLNSGVAPSPVYASSATAGNSAVLASPALAVNTTHYLFVKAGGPGEESQWAVFPPASTLANSPVSAASTFSAVGYNSFSVKWSANGNPLGDTRYTVQVSTAQNFNAGVTDQVTFATAPAAGPGAEFSGLSSDTFYYFRVRAGHNDGSFTGWVNLGFTRTLILPAIHAAGDGVLIYGQSGNSLPQFRDYASASNGFSSVRNTVTGAAGNLFAIKTNPLTSKQEAVAAYTRNGTLRVLCTDGANWYEEWTQTVGTNDNTRRFDIAFETASGDVLVLYSRNAGGADELGYRTKPGSAGCGAANWSGAATLDPVRTSGVVHWVKLASDPRASSDTIAAVWADANSDLSAMVWNGDSWENEPAAALETSLEYVTVPQDVEDLDVKFESLSGDLMVVWANSAGADGTNGVRYATAAWTGGSPLHTWGNPVVPATFLDDATNLELAANPASDQMIFASIGNAGSDLQIGYWSGSAWTNTANVDTSAQTPLAGTRLVSAAWLTAAPTTRWVVAYNDAAATNIGWYYGTTGTPTAGADAAPAPAFGNPQKYYQLQQDPVNRDRAVLAVSDVNSALMAKRLVMTSVPAFTWTDAAGGAALETALSAAAGDYAFTFWPAPPTTTFEQSSFRFFANADTTDVGAPLAGQNALAALPAAGADFRLRLLLHIGQVDLPVSGQDFKLQFADQGDGTCQAPSNGTPAVYTDVTAGTALAFKNNTPADRAALTPNAADPKHGAHVNVNQVYAESGGFLNSAAGINRNQDGMWDLALKDNGMSPGAIYCLRLTRNDGTPLEYYTVYPRVVSPSMLLLNEVYPSGASAADDWAELYNNSQSTVPLTGWKLNYIENTIALGGSASTVWTGQAGQYVNAMSTFLVSGLSLDLNGGQSYHVKLLDAAGGLVSQAQWPGPGALSPGQSFARISDGHPDYFEIDPTPTPGYANAVSTDPFKLNEVSYGALTDEFVELYNASAVSTATLRGYSLRSAASSAAGQVFRFTRKLYPRDFAAFDGSSLSSDALAYTAVFGAGGLAPAGDFLTLENSTGATVSQLTWQSGAVYTRYNYAGQLVPYVNPAPANAAYSIVRGPTEGADTGNLAVDLTAAAFATMASRNNGAAGAAANALTYPAPAAGPRYLSRRFPLNLSLGENSSAGRGNNLVFSRVGGAADPGSPHLYRLADIGFNLSSLSPQATVQFGLQFNDQDGLPLVSSAVYRFIFNSDNGSASAPQIVVGSAAYDASVHAGSASVPPAPLLINNDTRTGAVRLDVSNNSPAGFNGVEVATVAFKLLDPALAPLNTAQARELFDAILLVADSTSTGLSGTYEPAIDVATAAYAPMASISLDAAGLSTLTVPTTGLGAAYVAAGSTRPFYLVFVSTRDASSKTPNAFRVRFDPATGVRIRDASALLDQALTPGAQVDTSSFTLMAPALPPPDTTWPFVSASSAPITAAITSYEGGLQPEVRLYMPSTDGTVVSVSTSGALLWTFVTSPPTAVGTSPSFPQEEGGSVYLYFAGANGDVYKIRDDGGSAAQSWKAPLGAAVRSMLDTEARLYVAAADNKVHCLNKADGQACSGWGFSSAVTAPPSGTLTVDERASVVTAWTGLEDGKIVSLQTGDGTSGTVFATGGPIKSSPFLDAYNASLDNALYVTSTDGKIYAVNSGNMTALTGWIDFDAGSPIYTSPFLWPLGGTKYIFFGADNGRLYKLDAATGALAWYFQAGGAIRSSPVLVPAGYVGLGAGEDYVYFGCDDGRIYGVNANTGQVRSGWPVATGGPVRADPAADPTTMTISAGSNDGRLYTLYIGP